MNKPELLIPAGNFEKLQTAVLFGADAVYVGAGPYSLRTHQTAFTLSDLKKGINFAHKYKVKLYLAMNIFAFDNDLLKMQTYLKKAIKLGVDGVIVSDVGLINIIRNLNKKIKIHLSTQANTLNSEAIKFWQKQGIKRVVLGREVTLKQAQSIKKNNPNMEIELFIHGAMCISYSGRCLLSKHMTGRSANQGECTHPCRWEYRLKEVSRPEEEFKIEQDQRSTYILNSKDLCMIEHIPKLIKAGFDSFKIEGRMKSIYYVAIVTKIYREAIDNYLAAPNNYKFNSEWKNELNKVSHRYYSTGLYLGEKNTENIKDGSCMRKYAFVGTVKSHKNQLEVLVRNYFKVGDTLDIIDPNQREIISFKVKTITTKKGEKVDKAHNNYHVYMPIKNKLPISPKSLLRKKL